MKKKSGKSYQFDFVRDPAEGDRAGKASIAKRPCAVPGIPTMYVIDAKGKNRRVVCGSGNKKKLVEILGTLGIKAKAR